MSGTKILIVDDDDKTVFAMSAALAARGYTTVGAINGKDCLNVLNDNADIKLILLDLRMPIMDGYDAIKAIKLKPDTKNIPIIVLTAYGDDYRTKAFEFGANAALTKPIDIDFLTILIKRFLN